MGIRETNLCDVLFGNREYPGEGHPLLWLPSKEVRNGFERGMAGKSGAGIGLTHLSTSWQTLSTHYCQVPRKLGFYSGEYTGSSGATGSSESATNGVTFITQ